MLTIDIPYLMGLLPSPHNPEGFPDRLDIALDMTSDGLVYQSPCEDVMRLNDMAYAKGSLLGTAMDDSVLGARYADDAYAFLKSCLPDLRQSRILEIGCGRGGLLAKLAMESTECIGLEPGGQNKPFWNKYKLNVIQDMFPSPKVVGTFDLIIGFLVLEHVFDLKVFLASVKAALNDSGSVFFAVPNCTDFIQDGDISMLIHQHFYYFSGDTLASTLEQNGFSVKIVKPASVGGVLYIHAMKGLDVQSSATRASNITDFGLKASKLSDKIKEVLANYDDLGIYCPGRIINFFPPDCRIVRFFDDDPELHGKFYPGIPVPIENFRNLEVNPPKHMLIASRAFGREIKNKIVISGCVGEDSIILWNEVVAHV